MKPIETTRLRLMLYAPDQLRVLHEHPAQFEALIGYPAAEGLLAFFTSGEISPAYLAKLRESSTPDPWVHGFAALHRASHSVIGSGGFKGPPDEKGRVEIAYGVVPGFEGQGYATEVAAALVEFAFADARVRLVCAHTLPANEASGKVLAKCGFTPVGEVADPEDGLVRRWELGRSSLSTT